MKDIKTEFDNLQDFAIDSNQLKEVKGGFFLSMFLIPTVEASPDGNGIDIVHRNLSGREISRYCIQTPDLANF